MATAPMAAALQTTFFMIVTPVAAYRRLAAAIPLLAGSTPREDKRLVARLDRRQRRHQDMRSCAWLTLRITVATNPSGGAGSMAAARASTRSSAAPVSVGSAGELIESSWLQAEQLAQPLPRLAQARLHRSVG